MGVIRKFQENNCLIAIWDIHESLEELLLLGQEFDSSGFFSSKRKKEFLVSRLLLNEIHLGQNITYNRYGAPEISNGNNISISHSRNLVALISSEQRVGIDIQEISNQPLRLSSKFISEEDHHNLSEEKATLIWCCKEAIFKWHQEGSVDFKYDIVLSPFSLESAGKITAIFKDKEYRLYYKKINTHFLVYLSANICS